MLFVVQSNYMRTLLFLSGICCLAGCDDSQSDQLPQQPQTNEVANSELLSDGSELDAAKARRAVGQTPLSADNSDSSVAECRISNEYGDNFEGPCLFHLNERGSFEIGSINGGDLFLEH